MTSLKRPRTFVIAAIVLCIIAGCIVVAREYRRHHLLISDIKVVSSLMRAVGIEMSNPNLFCGRAQAKVGRGQKSCSIEVISSTRMSNAERVRSQVDLFKATLTVDHIPVYTLWDSGENADQLDSLDNIAYFKNANTTSHRNACSASYRYDRAMETLELRYRCDDSSWLTRLMDGVGLYK